MKPKFHRSSSWCGWCDNREEEYPVIYRLVLNEGYRSLYFDFKTVEEAGEFARVALMHNVRGSALRIKIEVIPLNMFGENDKEDEDE